jgi:hypothetical protein
VAHVHLDFIVQVDLLQHRARMEHTMTTYTEIVFVNHVMQEKQHQVINNLK